MRDGARARRGTVLTAMGLLLIAAALSLTAYNLVDDSRAGRSSGKILEMLESEGERVWEGEREDGINNSGNSSANNNSANNNSRDGGRSGGGNTGVAMAEDSRPLFERYPEMEMPVKEIDGNYYIGILEFPGLDRRLPVMEEWSYPNLKVSPCRFSGSAYDGSLVIAGHNYSSHFSPIKNMSEGEEVRFTDMDGNVFVYEVSSAEVLQPTAVEEMESGDWDLTLFTCTYGGKTRFALRCTLVGTKTAGKLDS